MNEVSIHNYSNSPTPTLPEQQLTQKIQSLQQTLGSDTLKVLGSQSQSNVVVRSTKAITNTTRQSQGQKLGQI